MSVSTRYYVGLPGATQIRHAALLNVTILQVTRAGTTYYKAFAPSADLQFSYSPSRGVILFYNEFSGPAPGDPFSLSQLEQISVKIKT